MWCGMCQERDQDQQRIVQLMRENARLEFDQKLLSGESCSVDDQIKKAFNAAGGDYLIFSICHSV